MMNTMQLVQMMRGGGNPMQTLMSAAQVNPQLGQVMRMMNGKTPQEMQQMVFDTARQRGVDVHQLAQQLGIRLPG